MKPYAEAMAHHEAARAEANTNAHTAAEAGDRAAAQRFTDSAYAHTSWMTRLNVLHYGHTHDPLPGEQPII